ncbi:hypothetical protein M0802_015774 [Mischocyttarus mexicanus]|nr:hypothetical protein M0802_015774 [Mischocyttarus mexicanus]
MDFLLVINGSLMTVGTAVEWEYVLWSLEFSLSKLIAFKGTMTLVGVIEWSRTIVGLDIGKTSPLLTAYWQVVVLGKRIYFTLWQLLEFRGYHRIRVILRRWRIKRCGSVGEVERWMGDRIGSRGVAEGGPVGLGGVVSLG